MANLQYGDIVKFQYCGSVFEINEIVDVAPIRFDTINEDWIVCAQNDATHMLIVANVSTHVDLDEIKYMMIEIGKCKNLYLLADAIVE